MVNSKSSSSSSKSVTTNKPVLELQRGRCNNSNNQSYPNPCIGCISVANTGMEIVPCRFANFRSFERKGKHLVGGPYFQTNSRRSFSPRSIFNDTSPTLTRAQQVYIQEALRPMMKRLLERDVLVMLKLKDSVHRRPPTTNMRHNCDYCLTSIFNLYYMCKICGVELCTDCFGLDDSEWDVTDGNNKTNSSDDDFTDLTSCILKRRHNKTHFFPISKYNLNDLMILRYELSMIILDQQTYSHLSSPSQSPGMTTSVNSSSSSTFSEQPISTNGSPKSPLLSPLSSTTNQKSPRHTPTLDISSLTLVSTTDSNTIPPHRQLLVTSVKDITLAQFQTYWQTGKPALIQDTLDKSQIPWTPDFLCSNYGKEHIDAIDCRNMKITPMTIKEFFKGYTSRQQNDNTTPVLKIKDWPPGSDFKTECPLMYKDFMGMLPVPDYCTADGVFNLSNRLPEFFVKPDLGPKMFIAYGLDSLDATCQVGTTNLHCDMTDAVNVMCHAQEYNNNNSNNIRHGNSKKYDYGVSATPGKAAAVWDIFAFDDLPVLRQFVAKLQDERQQLDQLPPANKVDPIHGQWIYLNEALLNRLDVEHGVKSWRLYQNPGDAIYIPAGCAHQVINYQNAIKCAFDFISPENIERSAVITQQFGNARREDALQLKTTIVYSWMSAYGRRDSSSLTEKMADYINDDDMDDSTRRDGQTRVNNKRAAGSSTGDDSEQDLVNNNTIRRRRE
ncbi:hypothetical protein BC941DRAFT_422442 [Chlamydoabsidia padenii]|nr:hypothetical protein BC941DRAFT_422442 [Chlamydoabsidia padenii]